MRRSFRTREGYHTETQGVALVWYASPLQGEGRIQMSKLQGRLFREKPNVQTLGRPFRRKQGPIVESIATIRSMDAVAPVKWGERLIDIRLRTVAKSDEDAGNASLTSRPATVQRLETGVKGRGLKGLVFP
jgi:hypothetical protein